MKVHVDISVDCMACEATKKYGEQNYISIDSAIFKSACEKHSFWKCGICKQTKLSFPFAVCNFCSTNGKSY